MKPLQAIAMGMVIHLLYAEAGGFDLLADPLGWVLVIVGIRGLPARLELRSTLLVLAAVAAAVSVPLWIPEVVDALEDGDESVAWALNLPKLGCYLLLCVVLGRAATEAGERVAATWWGALVLALVLVAALPALIFGGGVDGLTDLASFLVGIVPTVVVVLLFWYAGRPWAGAPPPSARPAEKMSGDDVENA